MRTSKVGAFLTTRADKTHSAGTRRRCGSCPNPLSGFERTRRIVRTGEDAQSLSSIDRWLLT